MTASCYHVKAFSFAALIFTLVSLVTGTGSPLPAQDADSSPNTWTTGESIPVPVAGAAFGVIKGKIYVVSGATTTTIVKNNQIYDPATNKWSMGKNIPTARYVAASAVVDNILYVIGGCNVSAECVIGGGAMKVVEAYDPATDSWTTKHPIPIRNGIDSVYAIADSNIIYVVGGYVPGSGRVATVYAYNPTTDSWVQKTSMHVGRSNPMLGVLEGIMAVGGLGNSGNVTDDEVFSPTKNMWNTGTPFPTPLADSCFGVITGQFYIAGGAGGGNNDTPESAVFAYSPKTKSWNTGLAPMPQATLAPASGVVGGKLYCIGGSDNGILFPSTVYDNVQIYEP
jgi:N-acetylneuraminic acid mutarotase